jgi:hypothetical protein
LHSLPHSWEQMALAYDSNHYYDDCKHDVMVCMVCV